MQDFLNLHSLHYTITYLNDLVGISNGAGRYLIAEDFAYVIKPKGA